MSTKNSSDWSIADQSNFTQIYAPNISLSNTENRRSLSCSYQKLFKKQPGAFYFEMDSSNLVTYKLLSKSNLVTYKLLYLSYFAKK